MSHAQVSSSVLANALPEHSSSFIAELMLHQFRNYSSFKVSLNSSAVVISGPNGIGKTNILEAISLLSPGRGLRGVKLSQLTHLLTLQDNPRATWALSAQISTSTGDMILGTGLDYTSTGSERRLIKIQGNIVKSQAELTQWINVIWMTPEQDRLFMESTSARRKFIDRMVYVLDPEHSSRIHRYEHHVRERSMLLQQDRYDPVWIQALEERIAGDGVAIAAARTDLVRRLVASQNSELNYPFPQFYGHLTGHVESWLEEKPALAVEEEFVRLLTQMRSQDRQTGGAGVGPHRSDLKIYHGKKKNNCRSLFNRRAEDASVGFDSCVC